MVNIAYIEKRCRQLNLQALPALNQLKLANERKDFVTVERIASNIIEFLALNYNVHISATGCDRCSSNDATKCISQYPPSRSSQPPSQRPIQL